MQCCFAAFRHSHKNRDQFVRLKQEVFDLLVGDTTVVGKKFQPKVRLVRLLNTDFQFRDKLARRPSS